ncbi:hypothetical protein [Actinoplanes rectilineatus]|nr:hypothetical protein [Actinoplanes rectilineatus]
MAADGNRERVVRAVIPLMGDYQSLTMARIAEAAGIDELFLLGGRL